VIPRRRLALWAAWAAAAVVLAAAIALWWRQSPSAGAAGAPIGLAVLPFCPFVRRFIAENAGYADLVPEKDRQRFGLTEEVAD